MVKEVLSDLEIRIEETRARVEVCRLPVIDADALQMRQLLQNLLSNALKFHRQGEPPRIKIDYRVPPAKSASSREEVFCEISIADNGIGFERRYLDRIFNVFQRLHGRGVYEGTGIGLAVCRKIVERHGGHITANSKPGVGSTFIVELPIKHQQEEGNDSEQTW